MSKLQTILLFLSESMTAPLLISALFLIICLIFILDRSEGERKKFSKTFPYYFFHYSGIEVIYRKFVPSPNKDEDKNLPTGVIWVIGLYFAVYAFTVQRYESQLDKVEYKYMMFTTQVAAGTRFSNERLMGILNEKIPVKPYIYNSISIAKSFLYNLYTTPFYQTITDKNNQPFISATAFRQEIITQWDHRLNKADFRNAIQLEGASFSGAELYNAYFDGAQLNGADFKGANLKRAIFDGAHLKGASFNYSMIEEAMFQSTQLEKASFKWTRLNRASFSGAVLNGTAFNSAELEGGALAWPRLKRLILAEPNLIGVILGGLNSTRFIFVIPNLKALGSWRLNLKTWISVMPFLKKLISRMHNS